MKVFSPTVQRIELVKKAERRIRRARLFYMRYVPIFYFSSSGGFYLGFLGGEGGCCQKSLEEKGGRGRGNTA